MREIETCRTFSHQFQGKKSKLREKGKYFFSLSRSAQDHQDPQVWPPAGEEGRLRQPLLPGGGKPEAHHHVDQSGELFIHSIINTKIAGKSVHKTNLALEAEAAVTTMAS